MKADELMVGDLLHVNKDVCLKKGTIVEVRGIDADNAFPEKGLKGSATCANINDHCKFGGIWVDFLEPIPLTTEILEKNGFESDIGGGGLIQMTIEGINCSINFNIIHYVHELQHALKLCGIKKQIKP